MGGTTKINKYSVTVNGLIANGILVRSFATFGLNLDSESKLFSDKSLTGL